MEFAKAQGLIMRMEVTMVGSSLVPAMAGGSSVITGTIVRLIADFASSTSLCYLFHVSCSRVKYELYSLDTGMKERGTSILGESLEGFQTEGNQAFETSCVGRWAYEAFKQ